RWLPMNPAPPVTRTLRCPSAIGLPLRPAEGVIGKALAPNALRVEHVPTVEDDRILHLGFESLEIRPSELVPLGNEEETIRSFGRGVRLIHIGNSVTEDPFGRFVGHRVVSDNPRPLPKQPFDQRN